MTADRQHIYSLIDAERDAQDAKWGENSKRIDLTPFIRSAILQEEVGEVAQAVLKEHDKEWSSAKARANLAKELVQTTAVSIAWLEVLLSELD